MVINRNALSEYPYNGIFYTVKKNEYPDGDFLGGDSEDGEAHGGDIILLKTLCDIQLQSHTVNNGTIMADYKVFFPWEHGKEIPIPLNAIFKCEDYAVPLIGRVLGISMSQLGGCTVDIGCTEV